MLAWRSLAVQSRLRRARQSFLSDAQQSLVEALNRLDPMLMRRSPQYHVDIAATYIPQGNIELACTHALQAATIVAQVKAQTVFHRLVHSRLLVTLDSTPFFRVCTSF